MTAENDSITAFVDLLEALDRGDHPSVDEFMAGLDEDDRRLFRAILNARSELKASKKRVLDSLEPFLMQTEALCESRSLPEVLEELERQKLDAGEDREDLISRIADAADVPDHMQDKFADYYQKLSYGAIDPRGVTPRLLDAISQTMGAAVNRLLAAASVPFRLGPQVEPQFTRLEEGQQESIPREQPEQKEEEPDLVDRMFFGDLPDGE